MKLHRGPAPALAEEGPSGAEAPRVASQERVDAEIPEAVRSVLDHTESARERAPASAAVASSEAAPAPMAAGTLVIGRVLTVRDDEIDLMIGGEIVTSKKFGALHASVLATAQRTGEPVIAQRNADGSFEIMGALRTQPTPGVDQLREIVLEADRIELHGRKEVALTTSGIAAIALRAVGEVETYADRIVSRAEELHKIVGRMLRLN